MPILDARHDRAHPVEGDDAWSESYYFNAYDPPTDTGFFTRIGIRPNEGTMDVGLSLWLPGDELAEYRAVREQHEMVDSDLSVGDVRYRMLEPMSRWHLGMEGRARARPCRGAGPEREVAVSLDATFSALMPPVGTDGQGRGRPSSDAAAAAAQTVGKGHFEQAGRWSGTLHVDGGQHRWSEARGNRDRSWGPRRWGGPLMWRWFSVNFGDDVHFGGIRIGAQAGDLHRGWVWEEGRATSIREWRVRTTTEDDGLTQRECDVVAVDKAGREHELDGTLLRVAAIRQPAGKAGTVVNEGLAQWRYGGLTGYGIAEYLHQLDPDGRPAVALE
jgi:hypothetical protein